VHYFSWRSSTLSGRLEYYINDQIHFAERCCNRGPGGPGNSEKALRRYGPEYSAIAVIRVKGGIVHCSKGSISNSALRGVQRGVEEGAIVHATFRMTKAGKIRFSNSIPASERQRLRNIRLSA
jgi:hypothetical protein